MPAAAHQRGSFPIYAIRRPDKQSVAQYVCEVGISDAPIGIYSRKPTPKSGIGSGWNWGSSPICDSRVSIRHLAGVGRGQASVSRNDWRRGSKAATHAGTTSCIPGRILIWIEIVGHWRLRFAVTLDRKDGEATRRAVLFMRLGHDTWYAYMWADSTPEGLTRPQ